MKKLYSHALPLILTLIMLVSWLSSCGSSEDGNDDNLLLSKIGTAHYDTSMEYDYQNRLIKKILSNKDSEGNVHTLQAYICTYNNDGQLVKVIGDDKENDYAETLDIVYHLDTVFVNRIKFVGQNTLISTDTLRLNDLNQVVKSIDGGTGLLTEYEYEDGKLIKKIEITNSGKSKRIVTTMYSYDGNKSAYYFNSKVNSLANFYFSHFTQRSLENLTEIKVEDAIYNAGRLKKDTTYTTSYEYTFNIEGYPTKVRRSVEEGKYEEETLEYIREQKEK